MKRIIIALLAFLTLIPVLGADTLAGEYIGGAEDEGEAILLRKAFTVKATGEQWVLSVNSLGYHEAYINGTKVTDAVLMPAVSQLNKRSLVVSYDVTHLIRKGRNELVLWIGSGWYKAKTFAGNNCGPLVKAELSPNTHHPSPNTHHPSPNTHHPTPNTQHPSSPMLRGNTPIAAIATGARAKPIGLVERLLTRGWCQPRYRRRT